MEMNIIASEPYPDMKFVDENDKKLVEHDHLLSNSDFLVESTCCITSFAIDSP